MKRTVTKFISNVSYAVISNVIAVLFSVTLVLILPKFFSIESYGYWQLYLFYIGYVGFLHLGWNDGIYLRYGGNNYADLDKKLFNSQLIMLVTLQVIFALMIFFISLTQTIEQRKVIIQFVALGAVIVNTRYMFMYLLQATNRIKEYAIINLLDKFTSLMLIIILVFCGVKEIEYIIFSDLIGKFLSLIFSLYCCKDIAFNKISSFIFSFKEAKENISAGIKLMLANVAGILIVGNVRFGIERNWDVVVFGKVSFILSITNMLMIFINSLGIVMFPILKRVDERKYTEIYLVIKNILMTVLILAMALYFPITELLSLWVPQYSDALSLLALLFPSLIFEAKTSMLINTFLKIKRKEKLMLRINAMVWILSLISTVGTVVVFNNLNAAVISIVVLLALKSIISEYCLSRLLNFPITKGTVLELLMAILFIVISYNSGFSISLSIFLIGLLFYLFITRREIIISVKRIKGYLRGGFI
ncbi:flippase [Paenibacillus agaridevorans]|uniref:Flippase n=1 Tax=Paenibacillus agaridevorans TaxID=171404 RepID=A0A2R5EWH4_9BACL|nr:hypothetical protein [Paenibacillus agaridevorans]GBG08143.1 flippase [Paenibacillus agaridevorans]